jgi:phosphate transport system protein
MADHIVKSFDDELSQLRELVAEMGMLGEIAIAEAMATLATLDSERASKVVEGDARLDQLEADIDQTAVRIIALRAPVADDLRDVIAALKISGIAERIGDYAKNIAKRVPIISNVKAQIAPLTIVMAMGEIAQSMVADVLKAYAARDDVLAVDVIQRDQKLDNFYDSVFRNLVSHMMENPATIGTAAHLLFVARNLERIGDHATNAAEMVYFAATGLYFSQREMAAQAEKV